MLPSDEGAIFRNIRVRMEEFSEGQKKIADMILNDYGQVVNMSSRALARELGISPSTVVRFAAELGYESYPKMLQDLRKTLIFIAHPPMKNMRKSIGGNIPLENLLENVLRHQAASLAPDRFTEMNDDFLRAAKFLSTAERVYITGARSSKPLAHYVAYMLGNMYERVFAIDPSADNRYEKMEKMGATDALLCISFQRYHKSAVEVVRFAHKRNVHIVGFTDYAISPIIPLCDEAFLLASDAPFATYLPTMAMLDALILGFIQMRGEEAKAFFNRRVELLMEENVYEELH